jgi:hypothetical protein
MSSFLSKLICQRGYRIHQSDGMLSKKMYDWSSGADLSFNAKKSEELKGTQINNTTLEHTLSSFKFIFDLILLQSLDPSNSAPKKTVFK